jgi:hypothetical protein
MVCRTLKNEFFPHIGYVLEFELSRKMKLHLHPALKTLLETILVVMESHEN